MTTLDATVPAAQPGPDVPARPAQSVRFLGAERDYWRLMIRGAARLAVTLGIYRFWLNTDMRHFLWSNTEVLGQPAEYTGTARELLVGFLIAIAILVPLYAGLFYLTIEFELIGQFAAVIGFVLLSVFGHYAVFRARRYRLTRTVYRGVRFHQTGSAWLYAAYASCWWLVVILTLGLAYPFMQSSLERYRMRNTWLGNLQGRFEGTAARLFLRGIGLWVLVFGPLGASVATLGVLIDGAFVQGIAEALEDEDVLKQMFTADPVFGVALAITLGAVIWSLLAALFLYPVFQAIVLRWWVEGIRFGDVILASALRIGQVYGAYLRFVGWAIVFSLIASIMFGMFLSVVVGFVQWSGMLYGEILLAVLGVAGYVVFALGYSTVYQVKARLGLWRAVVDTLDVKNAESLERVSSVGAPASPVGEGLADALNVGGF